jgi:hypothetical protein
MPVERIERWMMDEVVKYILTEFVETTVDTFPRGNGDAVLFRVEGRPSHTEPRRVLHQLWMDRSFFLRCADRTTLRAALEGLDVAKSMKKSGDKIVELR